jgi:hypothetical protein
MTEERRESEEANRKEDINQASQQDNTTSSVGG